MKKKIFGFIAVLAIAALAAFNVNVNSQENGLSDISMENIEALASEDTNSNCKWKQMKCSKGTGYYEGCLTNGDGNSCTCGSVSRDC
jgi:hypothetical protein